MNVLYSNDSKGFIQLLDGLLVITCIWHVLTVIVQKLTELSPVRLVIVIELPYAVRENRRDKHIVVAGRHSDRRVHQSQ